MRVLFLHQNFPGQFLHVAAHLQNDRRHDLVAVVPESNARPRLIPTRTYHFDPRRVRTIVPLARHHAERTARGTAAAAAMLVLKQARYDLRRVCLPAWLELMGDTAGQTASEPAEELVHA